MADTTPTCIWVSTGCSGPVVLHRMQVGDGPLREVYMCSDFHGQYWPRVGEAQESYLQRTKRARTQMTKPSQRKAYATRVAESRRKGQRRQRDRGKFTETPLPAEGEDDVSA